MDAGYYRSMVWSLIYRVNSLYSRAVFLGLLALFSVEVGAMGLFDFMKVCLFSEVNGVVTLEGKPVVGAELIRTAKLNDKVYTDRAVTDTSGKFHFDAMYTHSVNKMIFIIEPVIPQTITIGHNDKQYPGWRTTKRDYYENAELEEDRNIDLRCELINEPSVKDQKIRPPLYGVCSLREYE